jgi:hypothetical protein
VLPAMAARLDTVQILGKDYLEGNRTKNKNFSFIV